MCCVWGCCWELLEGSWSLCPGWDGASGCRFTAPGRWCQFLGCGAWGGVLCVTFAGGAWGTPWVGGSASSFEMPEDRDGRGGVDGRAPIGFADLMAAYDAVNFAAFDVAGHREHAADVPRRLSRSPAGRSHGESLLLLETGTYVDDESALVAPAGQSESLPAFLRMVRRVFVPRWWISATGCLIHRVPRVVVRVPAELPPFPRVPGTYLRRRLPAQGARWLDTPFTRAELDRALVARRWPWSPCRPCLRPRTHSLPYSPCITVRAPARRVRSPVPENVNTWRPVQRSVDAPPPSTNTIPPPAPHDPPPHTSCCMCSLRWVRVLMSTCRRVVSCVSGV